MYQWPKNARSGMHNPSPTARYLSMSSRVFLFFFSQAVAHSGNMAKPIQSSSSQDRGWLFLFVHSQMWVLLMKSYHLTFCMFLRHLLSNVSNVISSSCLIFYVSPPDSSMEITAVIEPRLGPQLEFAVPDLT